MGAGRGGVRVPPLSQGPGCGTGDAGDARCAEDAYLFNNLLWTLRLQGVVCGDVGDAYLFCIFLSITRFQVVEWERSVGCG